jgi:hypothetical protein
MAVPAVAVLQLVFRTTEGLRNRATLLLVLVMTAVSQEVAEPGIALVAVAVVPTRKARTRLLTVWAVLAGTAA